MKVYIYFEGVSYEGYWVEKVFDSKEKADEYCKNSNYAKDGDYEYKDVEEFEVE